DDLARDDDGVHRQHRQGRCSRRDGPVQGDLRRWGAPLPDHPADERDLDQVRPQVQAGVRVSATTPDVLSRDGAGLVIPKAEPTAALKERGFEWLLLSALLIAMVM